MSKKQKRLRNRLETLFTGMENVPPTGVPPTPAEESSRGWRWQADHQGRYTACSPQCADLTGYPPETWQGQPLTFALISDDTLRLEAALTAAVFPLEIGVLLQHKDGHSLPVVMHITRSAPEQGTPVGYQGFTQCQEPVISAPPPSSAAPRPTSYLPAKTPQGFLVSGDQFLPAEQPLTPAARQSLERREVVALQPGSSETPAALAAPIHLQDRTLGVLELVAENPQRAWSEDETQLVSQVVDQLSLALENATLFQQVQQSLQETEVLYDIVRVAGQTLDMESVLNEVLARVIQFTALDAAIITLENSQRSGLRVAAQRGLPEEIIAGMQATGLENTLCKIIYTTGQTLRISNLKNDRRGNAQQLSEMGWYAYLGVPLISKGRCIGTLCTFSRTVGAVDRVNASILEAAAQQVGVAVENATLFQETQRRALVERVLSDIVAELNRQEDSKEALPHIREQLQHILPVDVITLALATDAAHLSIYSIATRPGEGHFVEPGAMLPYEGTAVGWAARRASVVLDNHLSQVESRYLEDDRLKGQGMEARIVIPMMIGQRVLGTLNAASRQPDAFGPESQAIMQQVANQMALAIERRRLFEESQTRSAELAVLNEMGRQLSNLLDIQRIAETVYTYTSRLMNTEDFFMALYDEEAQTIVMPVCYDQGERIEVPPRPLGTSLTDHVLRTGTPLLLEENPMENLPEGVEVLFVGNADAPQCWLGVPMLLGQRVLGALVVQSTTTPRLYGAHERELLYSVAAQAAINIQNARLFAQTTQNLEETEALYQASRAIGEASRIEDILQGAGLLGRSLGMASVSLTLIRETDERGAPLSGDIYLMPLDKVPPQMSPPILGSPIVNREMTERILKDPDFALVYRDIEDPEENIPQHVRELLRNGNLRGSATLGLSARGEALAFLSFSSPTPLTTLPERHLRRMRTVADLVATRLENLQLFERTQQALSETSTLYQLSARFNAAGSIEVILEVLGIANITGDAPAGVALWQFHSDEKNRPVGMIFTHVWQRTKQNLPALHIGDYYDFKEYPGIRTLLNNPNAPLLIADPEQEIGDPNIRSVLVNNQIRSAAYLPLVLHDRWIGMASAYWEHPTRFERQDVQRYTALGAQAAIAINSRLLFEQTEQRARQLEWLSLIKDSLSLAQDEENILAALSMAFNTDTPPERVALFYLENNERGLPASAVMQAQWADGLAHTTSESIPIPLSAYQELPLWNERQDKLVFSRALENTDPLTGLYHTLVKAQTGQTAAILPLYNAGQWHGLIVMTWHQIHDLTPDETFYLSELIEPLSAVIATRRAYLSEQTIRQAIERRNLQLQTAAQVSRTASSILEPDELAHGTAALIRSRFNLYYVGLFLIDRTGNWTGEPERWAVLRAGTGEAGQQMLARQHKLSLDENSMIGRCIIAKEAQIWRGDEAEDIGRFVNPLLPRTRSEMALPLISRGEVIGAMTFQSERPGDFSTDDIAVLQTMADQVANALENARLFQESTRRTEELAFVNRIVGQVAASLDLNASLRIVAEALGKHLKMDVGIALINEMRTHLVVRTAYRQDDARPDPVGNRIPIEGNPSTQEVLQTQKPLVIQDAFNDPRIAPLHEIARRHGVYGIAILPIILGDEVIGTLGLDIRTPGRNYQREELNLAQSIITQISTAIQNARLFSQVQETLKETETLYTASAELNTATTYEDIIDVLMRHTLLGQNAQNVSLNLFDTPWLPGRRPRMVVTLARRSQLPQDAVSDRYLLDEFPSAGKVLFPDRPTIIEDLATHPDLDDNARALYTQRFKAVSTIFAPLVIAGQWVGYINAIYQQSMHFTETEVRRLSALANQAVVVIQNLQSVEITRRQAQEATLLYQATQNLVQAHSEDEIYHATLQACQEFGDVDTAAFQHFKTIGQEVFLEQILHRSKPDALSAEDGTLFPTDLYPYSRRVAGGAAVVSGHVEQDSALSPDERNLLREFGVQAMAAFPLRTRTGIPGQLLITYTQPHTFDESETRFYESLIVQTGIALDSYNLLQETQRRARQLQTAAEVSRAASSILDADELIQEIVNLVRERFDLYYVGLFLVDVSGEWSGDPGRWAVLRAGTGVAGLQMKARNHKLEIGGTSMVGQCVAHGQARVSLDVMQEAGRFQNPLLPDTRSELALPLMARGQVIGAISIQSELENAFTQEDIAVLQTMADQVAVAIQNARLFNQTQQTLAEQETLYQASADLTAAHDYKDVLRVLQRYTLLGNAPLHISLNLFDHPWEKERPAEWLIPLAEWRDPERGRNLEPMPARINVLPWARSGNIFNPTESAVIQDIESDPRLDDELRQIYQQTFQAHSLVLSPISVGGKWIGHITALYRHAIDPAPADIRRLNTLAAQAAVVIENQRNAEEIRERATLLERLTAIQTTLSQAANEDEIVMALATHNTFAHLADLITLRYTFTDENNIPLYSDSLAHWQDGALVHRENRFRVDLQSPDMAAFSSQVRGAQAIFYEDVATSPDAPQTLQMMAQAAGMHGMAILVLESGGRWQGSVIINWREPHPFQEEERFLLQNLLRPLSEVVARRRAYLAQRAAREESERRALQLQTASEIARETTGTLALGDLLERAITLIWQRFGLYHAAVYLMDESRLNAVIRVAAGAGAKEMLAANLQHQVGAATVIGQATLSGETLAVNDLGENETFHAPEYLPEARSELCLPLRVGNRVIGVVDVHASRGNVFQQDDIPALQILADQLAIAVDNARSYELASQRAQEMSQLFEISRTLSAAPLEIDELSRIITGQFAALLNAPLCTLSLILREYDEYTETYKEVMRIVGAHVAAGITPHHPHQKGEVAHLWGRGIINEVMQTLEPVLITLNDPLVAEDEKAYLLEHGFRTLLILPLAAKGEALGILEIALPDEERRYTVGQMDLAMTVAASAAVSLENARLYEEQRQTAERLKEVDTLKTQFLANMSHELRTPLNSIIGFSRVILKGIDGPINELQEQDLSAIYNSGQHLLSLINNILDLSKIEAGKMEIAQEDVNINMMVKSVLSTAIGLTKDKPVKLLSDVDENLPIITGDNTRIRQVLLNLVSNAAKFTEDGYIKIVAKLRPRATGKGQEVYMAVEDTGLGISPEDQAKLFKPFSQVDGSATRKTGGTGLGLSISKRFIEMHGGEIGIISEEGRGSTFWFTLPLTREAEEESPQEKEPSGGAQEQPETGVRRKVVLSIDDSSQVINLYQRYLENYGYDVVPLTDPARAVQTARDLQPDAITLDIMMPGTDGWTVLEALKRAPETRHIPVVVCSIVHEEEKGFSLGATDYLVKPILEEDLVQALARIAKNGSLQRILLVDDSEEDLRLVERTIKEHTDYEVLLAPGGQAALSVLQSSIPDAIILDLYMPDLDGFTLLETIRNDPNLASLPVVILTGGELSDEQRTLLREKSQALMHKSELKEEQFLEQLKALLNRLDGLNEAPTT
ncbi:MAG: hypothetical protein Fur0018_12660 [Anaerolineales bacterium]